MKKLFSILLFTVLPLALAVPGYMGWQTQKMMDELAAYIDQMPAYNARWQSYERGWFNSHGVLALEIADLHDYLGSEQPVVLPVNVSLSHGPVITQPQLAMGWFALDVQLTQDHEALLQEHLSLKEAGPAYQLQAVMALNTKVTFSDRWLPFTFKQGANTVELTEAYRGQGSLAADLVLDYRFTLPALKIAVQDNATNYSLSDVSATVNAQLADYHPANIMPGSVALNIGQVAAPAQDFLLQNLQLSSQSNFNDDRTLLSSRSQLLTKQLTFGDIALKDVGFDMDYGNISLSFIEAYQKHMSAMDDASKLDMQQTLGQLVIEQLLPESPWVALQNIRFSSPEGEFVGNIKLSVEGDALTQGQVSPLNPLTALPYFAANIDGVMARSLAERFAGLYLRQQMTQSAIAGQDLSEEDIQQSIAAQVPSIIQMLLLQNFIVEQGDNLAFTFEYQKGQATLNNQPMPLPF